jgi:hypothetical protein
MGVDPVSNDPSFEELLERDFSGSLAGQPIVETALREKSLQMLQNDIGAMLGHLSSYLPMDQISCAHLVCVPFVMDFVEFQKKHKGVRTSDDREPSLARKDGKDLEEIAKFVTYMAADRSFAQKLTPIPGFLTPRQAASMSMLWSKFARQAAKEIRKLGRREVNQSVVKVDYAAPIKHLLLSPRPMQVIYDMVSALIRRVDGSSPEGRDICLRDLFVVGVILCQDVFRSGMPGRLKYTEDESSNVVKEIDRDNGDIKLRVVADNTPFKNWDQEILKDGFSREIINLFGRLHPLVNEYLDVSRTRMVGRPTEILVVNTANNPRFTTDSFCDYLRRLTRRLLLVDLERKYGDVTSLNCTQIRKLVATAMWRAHPDDAELKAVSHALMNQIPWVYRFFAASERSKEMEELLRAQG